MKTQDRLPKADYFRMRYNNAIENGLTSKAEYYKSRLDQMNEPIIKETPKPKRVIKNKEYIFSFESGGWNTVWAKTLAGAKKQALGEYKDSDTLNVRLDSVTLATEDGLERAMSLFY